MKVLALDTTTRAGSVAIVEDDRVIEERAGEASRTHAERLPSEIVALLDAHRLRVTDLDLFAVASGPGTFTGLRIGIATMQGLAFVARRRIVAISALEAFAHLFADDEPTFVGAWMDAHRRDVFSALYLATPGAAFDIDRLTAIDAPAVGDPESTIARWQRLVGAERVTLTGDGATRYADLVARAASGWRLLPPPPLAGSIGRIAVVRARRGETLDPAGVRPLYIRRPDAELARERRVAD